jgi:hypothetical protein
VPPVTDAGLDDLRVPWQLAGIETLPNYATVRGEQRGNIACHLHPRGDKNDEVVADLFEVGDEM